MLKITLEIVGTGEKINCQLDGGADCSITDTPTFTHFGLLFKCKAQIYTALAVDQQTLYLLTDVLQEDAGYRKRWIRLYHLPQSKGIIVGRDSMPIPMQPPSTDLNLA